MPSSDGEHEDHQPSRLAVVSSSPARPGAPRARPRRARRTASRSSGAARRPRRARVPPRAVGAVGGHRVERVGDEDDPRAERDVLARQAVRVAAAVPGLVVVADPRVDRRDAEALEQPVADLGMLAQHDQLLVVERAGLLQDAVGDRDLAEVVQQAGEPQLLDRLVVEAQRAGDALDEPADRLRVRAGVGVLARRRRGSGSRRRAGGRGARPSSAISSAGARAHDVGV